MHVVRGKIFIGPELNENETGRELYTGCEKKKPMKTSKEHSTNRVDASITPYGTGNWVRREEGEGGGPPMTDRS